MSMLGNFAVEAAMKELLNLYNQLRQDEPDRFEYQLMVLVDKIKSIKDAAEKGYY